MSQVVMAIVVDVVGKTTVIMTAVAIIATVSMATVG